MAQFSRNCIELKSTIRCLVPLFSKIRDKSTGRVEYCRYAQRLMSVICEEGLTYLPSEQVSISTPTGVNYPGRQYDVNSIVAISIIRAGDSMLDTFTSIVPEAPIGKILIQRDEETAQPKLFYCKLPDLTNKHVVLLDPMLATGGSAICAIRVLIENGAREENILFFNVVCCPEGIRNMAAAYPEVKIITGEIDTGLNEKSYIIPGLGDFGDRFYGTK